MKKTLIVIAGIFGVAVATPASAQECPAPYVARDGSSSGIDANCLNAIDRVRSRGYNNGGGYFSQPLPIYDPFYANEEKIGKKKRFRINGQDVDMQYCGRGAGGWVYPNERCGSPAPQYGSSGAPQSNLDRQSNACNGNGVVMYVVNGVLHCDRRQ